MANEKKSNPLIGAFRSPELNTPPNAEKKPDDLPKVTADGKAPPPSADTSPGKTAEEKKPTDPPKVPADSKAIPPGIDTSPGKPAEEKKPAEPPKVPADSKATLPGGDTSPGEPAEEKKPVEPPKAPADSKAIPPGVVTFPGKPAGEKKPAGPPKSPADDKAPPSTGTPTPGKPNEEKKPAAALQTPVPEEIELPKDLHIPLTPTEGGETVTRLKLDEVHAFEGHPYSVKEDKDMWDLVESVKQFGVLEPAMVIPRDGGGYEIVSGHRRHRACQLAGLTEFPVIIRNLDRDEAIISMVDANLKRENISPMEKARAYDMKLSAMQRKVGRRSKMDVLIGEKPKQALEVLAEQSGESVSTIKRIRNLVKLEPELQDMVEKKVLPVNTASDISYLKPEEQKKLVDVMSREDKVPSGTQATELKKESQQGTLTTEKIEKAVAPTKKEIDPELKVTFTNDELRSYFPDKQTTVGDVKRVVFEALSLRARALERQAKKAAEEKALAQKPKEKQR